MKKLALTISLILILIIGPFNILKETIFPEPINKEVTRLHMNTGNTTRLSKSNPEDLSTYISSVLYPSIDEDNSPNGLIIIQSDNWSEIILLLPLVNKYKSPFIVVGDNISDKLSDYINQISLNGIKQLDNTELLLISKDSNKMKSLFEKYELKKKFISYKNNDDLQNKLIELPNYFDQIKYGFVINDKDALMSIPVSTWIIHSKNSIPILANETDLFNSSKVLLRNSNIDKLYVIGDDKKINLDIADISVEYITSNNPLKLSIDFSKYYDKETFVGWNATQERRDSGHNFILSSIDKPLMGLVASQLSIKGKVGPLLWTENKNLSPMIESYLWSLKPNYWVSPAEGPYNHVWIVGDEKIINYGIQGRIDYTQEVNSYEMMGEGGVSGLDILSILWIIASLGSALWVTIHLIFRMTSIFIMTKIMWILSSIILGPIGLWLYVISYKNRPWMKMQGNIMWKRPLWNQVLVATVMGLSFGGATMIAVAYMISSRGMPLINIPINSIFLLGSPMILQMIIVYIIAFLLNLFVFMPTMVIKMKNISYKVALRQSLPVVFISMTSVSIGMMGSMWWLHMVYSPMMPEENHILWWGFMYLSTIVGGIVAIIPNWWLVRYGKKMGTS